MLVSTWNSLEVVKLVVSSLTPVAVVLIGFWINRSIKRAEQATWFNQKLIEKRIALLDEALPALNDLYCYFLWIGPWKEFSPPEIIALKRRLDRLFYAYRPFFASDTMVAYLTFSAALFRVFGAPGADAHLRTEIRSADGDRVETFQGDWQLKWNGLFVAEGECTGRSEIRSRYEALLERLSGDVGANDSSAVRP